MSSGLKAYAIIDVVELVRLVVQNGTNGATWLTEKQLQAIPHLVASRSRSEAAKQAEIGRTTLYHWMEDEEFRKEIERLRDEALALAHVELKGLMLKATH